MAEAMLARLQDETDTNRHLPPHVRSAHCIAGVCHLVDRPLTLLDALDEETQ